MEVKADVEVQQGQKLEIEVLLKNERAVAGLGALNTGGLRIGCCEKIDTEAALKEAVGLAKEVDVPIVIAGLNADYESEATDREDLKLPVAVDRLIASVLEARPDAVSSLIIMRQKLYMADNAFRLSSYKQVALWRCHGSRRLIP